MNTLSTPALNILNSYLNLPFKLGGVQTPYYNNERLKLHAGLRVLIGKGSPADIMEEALIISLHDKIKLDLLSPDLIKKFLVDHKIGVDCSALVYYTLNEELKARGKTGLNRQLKFPLVKNPWRKLLTRLRPAENTNVTTLASDQNSRVVKLNELKPGDLIVLRNTGAKHTLQHVLLVHAVGQNTIHYTHAFAWSSEGRYGHGVRQGKIELTPKSENLLDQTWEEFGLQNDKNETYQHAKLAERLELRRLNSLA